MGSVLLAYSGGVDSTLLLKIAGDVLKDKVLAVTADSAIHPKEELLFSRKTAKSLAVKHKIIRTVELEDKNFTVNPSNRCYFCKKGLFSRLKTLADKHRLKFVIDGSNLSDKDDFRPGDQAKKELNIRSPLAEAGFTKQDIRKISKKLNLSTWNKPSFSCLATRIPCHIKISLPLLKRIHHAEAFLKKFKFKHVRVRDYGGLCRIETAKEDIPLFIHKRSLVVKKLKQLGYDYVTLDLEGYHRGTLNERKNSGNSKV